jgi:hypothetical protein
MVPGSAKGSSLAVRADMDMEREYCTERVKCRERDWLGKELRVC